MEKFVAAEEAHKKMKREKNGKTMRHAKADLKKDTEQREAAGLPAEGIYFL